MRKVLGIVAVVALALPIEGVAATPGAASGGTRCKGLIATAQFVPGLPVLSRSKQVVSTVTSTGTMKHCAGGGVASGTFTISYRFTGNCTTLLTYRAAATKLRFRTTWDTKQSSTAEIQVHSVKAEPTRHTVSGTVTAGLFKGAHLSTTFTIALVTKAGCLNASLKELSVVGGPVVIK